LHQSPGWQRGQSWKIAATEAWANYGTAEQIDTLNYTGIVAGNAFSINESFPYNDLWQLTGMGASNSNGQGLL
jgi:hypothetical protein